MALSPYHAVIGPPHFSGRNLRSVEAGNFTSFSAGLIGRRTNSPPQFGQSAPGSLVRAQSTHQVHSKEQRNWVSTPTSA